MNAVAIYLRLARSSNWPLLALSLLGLAIVIFVDRTSKLPICAAGGAWFVSPAEFAVFPAVGGIKREQLIAVIVAMPLAMTSPLVAELIDHIRLSSLYERRPRAIALFLFGHFSIWATAAAVLLACGAFLQLVIPAQITATVLVIAAGLLWEGTPYKVGLRNRSCLKQPIPACGVEADSAAMRLGAENALFCASSCWALMLAPMTSGVGHIPLMMASAALMLSEVYAKPLGAIIRWRFVAAGASVASLAGLSLISGSF